MRQWEQGGVVMCGYAKVEASKETGVTKHGVISKVLFFNDARAFSLEEVYTSLYYARSKRLSARRDLNHMFYLTIKDLLQGTNVEGEALGLIEKKLDKLAYSLDHDPSTTYNFDLPNPSRPTASANLLPLQDASDAAPEKLGVTEEAPFMPLENVLNDYTV